jgi:hypothetical protein
MNRPYLFTTGLVTFKAGSANHRSCDRWSAAFRWISGKDHKGTKKARISVLVDSLQCRLSYDFAGYSPFAFHSPKMGRMGFSVGNLKHFK